MVVEKKNFKANKAGKKAENGKNKPSSFSPKKEQNNKSKKNKSNNDNKAKPKSLKDLQKAQNSSSSSGGNNNTNNKAYKAKKATGSKDSSKKGKFVPKKGKSDSKTTTSKSSTGHKDYKSFKPHFKLVEGLKTQWNLLRQRQTSSEERNKILKQMLQQVESSVHEVTLRHDASRMVQCLLQFGSDQQKDLILNKLLPKLHEIAKTPYGHFVVLKAITYCNQPSAMKKIVQALAKHFVSLSTHVIGARTVESVTQLYPPNLLRSLKGELYGKNFSVLCAESPKTLQALVNELPGKREAILDHMRDLITQKFITKGLLDFNYTHNLIWEYVQQLVRPAVSAEEGVSSDAGKEYSSSDKDRHRMEELVTALADSAPKLLSTKAGARAMTTIISCASAKERKRILKSLKGHCLESLLHDSAYLGILRLVDATDDTVTVQKTLFDELRAATTSKTQYTASGEVAQVNLPAWVRIARHKNGHKLLLRLLAPQGRCLEPDEALLFSAQPWFSKKDPAIKRKEHLLYIKDSLLSILQQHLEVLMRCKIGSRVVEAAFQAFEDAQLADSIARTFCGLPVQVEAAEEMVNEEDEEEEDMEEEEEEEDMEEEEEEDEDEEAEQGEEDGEGEDEEVDEEDVEAEQEDDEDYQAQLQEAIEDRKQGAGAKETKDTENDQQAWLPIEEDVAAHALFKRLMHWEAALEAHDNPSSKKVALLQKVLQRIQENDNSSSNQHKRDQDLSTLVSQWDRSLWSTSDGENELPSVARLVLQYLIDNESSTSSPRLLLLQWLHCNRACFSLLELFQVPSMLADHLESTFSLVHPEEREGILSNEEQHGLGKKLLFAFYDAYKEITSTPKSKTAPASAAKGKKKATGKK